MDICNNYWTIINNALKKNREEQGNHAHHILPKSIFPEYANFNQNPWNKVVLTPREHFIIHYQLCKIYAYDKRYNYKMIKAFTRMQKSSNTVTFYTNSRLYEAAVKNKSMLLEETKKKISETIKTKYKNDPTYRQRVSEGTKKAMANPIIWQKFLENNRKADSYRKRIKYWSTHEHTQEYKDKMRKTLSQYKFWNNGITNCFSIESPGPEFVRGRIKTGPRKKKEKIFLK